MLTSFLQELLSHKEIRESIEVIMFLMPASDFDFDSVKGPLNKLLHEWQKKVIEALEAKKKKKSSNSNNTNTNSGSSSNKLRADDSPDDVTPRERSRSLSKSTGMKERFSIFFGATSENKANPRKSVVPPKDSLSPQDRMSTLLKQTPPPMPAPRPLPPARDRVSRRVPPAVPPPVPGRPRITTSEQ
jgi:hypothetical protein